MVVQTRRLVLREFQEGDWLALFTYQSDPRYLRYYPVNIRMEADTRLLLQRFIQWHQEHPRTKFQLAVTPGPEGPLIGACGLRKATPAATEGDMGYEIAPWYWGYGYATEVAEAMLAFGFRRLALARITATCIAENRASVRVLEKLGLCCEERRPASCWMKGRWWERLRWSIARERWMAREQSAQR